MYGNWWVFSYVHRSRHIIASMSSDRNLSIATWKVTNSINYRMYKPSIKIFLQVRDLRATLPFEGLLTEAEYLHILTSKGLFSVVHHHQYVIEFGVAWRAPGS